MSRQINQPPDLSGATEADIFRLLASTKQLDNELLALFLAVPFSSLPRIQVAMRLTWSSITHCNGISILVGATEYQPAFALLRPAVENLLRGVWVCDCAAEAWMEGFTADPPGGVFVEEHVTWPTLDGIAHDLQRVGHPAAASQVRGLLLRLGDAAHADVHGGYRSIIRAFDRAPWKQLAKLLYYRNAIAANAFAYLSVIAARPELVEQVERVNDRNPTCYWTAPGDPPGLLAFNRWR